MTAMDVWMLICMIFVGLAKFEYAIQLKIRFGSMSKINTDGDKNSKIKIEEKCRKIDRYALIILSSLYALTAGCYYSYNGRS